MPERNAVGTFSPVVYFESPTGKISLPGTGEERQRGQDGWVRKEAVTLRAVDELQRRLEEQDRREMRDALDRDEAVCSQRRQRTRENLLNTLTRDSTSHYEKEFVREYLAMSDQRKKKFYQKDKGMAAYFLAREYDDFGNKVIQE